MNFRKFLKKHIPYLILFLSIIVVDLIFNLDWVNAEYVFMFALGYTVIMFFEYFRKSNTHNKSP